MTREQFTKLVSIDAVKGCWQWKGSVTTEGYGRIWFAGKSHAAHRLSFELFKGPVEPYENVRQTCGHRCCVCPTHIVKVCREHALLAISSLEGLKSQCTENAGGCWVWKGTRDDKGYPIGPRIAGTRLIHRIAYRLAHGPFPPRLMVCHKCDNPPCCNPDHLFLGTQSDNHADMIAKGRGAFQNLEFQALLKERRGRQGVIAASAVEHIRKQRQAGVRLDVLAKQHGVSISLISAINVGKIYKSDHGPITRANVSYRKLSDEEVRSVRDLVGRGIPQHEVATRFGVTQSNVSCIIKGKTWKHVE